MLTERLASLCGCPADVSAHTWTRDLAARYYITPAAIDRAVRIVGSELDTQELDSTEVRDRISGYMEQISIGALARDVRRLPTVAVTFDPRLCSASESLDRVERQASYRAQSGAGLRLLFGGPPGGGKTQYALWLAKRLGRDVILKRPSDLLSKYVGESEQQIAEAFRTATRAGSVLVIDEADALLYDRSIATRSWEHSQIAEFLQQIQEYAGILIACTNRIDAVDPALRRRFHKHVTFGPIGEEVLEPALDHMFPGVDFSDDDLTALRNGPRLMMSDLATAAEMMRIDDRTREQVQDEGGTARDAVEEIIAGARTRGFTRRIGF
jgi:transitional endoplasmic reticulum ATPase